ncbi:unnamed protein product, partial [Rotaria sordida]
LIRPGKQTYDAFHAQGISGESFVPLVGQLSKNIKQHNNDAVMTYYEELVKKHGHIFLTSIGPLICLHVSEPDLLADVLSRNNTPNYVKSLKFNEIFVPLIGSHNLLVAQGSEHERARRMINPPGCGCGYSSL